MSKRYTQPEVSKQPPDTRINNISLGAFERRVLPWLAAKQPAWVMSDHLTWLGVLAAVLIGLFYWLTTYNLNWLWLVNLALVLHWYADSLDGTLARFRHMERNIYGFYVDHHMDALSVLVILLGLGLSPIMDLRVALLLLIAYFAMMIHVDLVSMCRETFKISFGGFGPTEARLVLIIGNIIIWSLNNPVYIFLGKSITLASILGLFIALIILSIFIVSGEIERRKIAKLDPGPDK